MIALFSDFGGDGPYTGQVKAVLARFAPGVPVVDLMADAPACDVQGSAYLLAAYAQSFPPGTVFLAVVDPGVGGERPACVVESDRRWYVGPGNGLFELVMRRAVTPPRAWSIDRRPDHLSATFHGRDLFAPEAARLARGGFPPGRPMAPNRAGCAHWPCDLEQIVYVDRYGNAMSGVRAAHISNSAAILIDGVRVRHAHTFSDVPAGAAFWYANSNGLLEIAVNRGRASESLGAKVGCPLRIVTAL